LNLASGGRVAPIPAAPPPAAAPTLDFERDIEPAAVVPGEVTRRLRELVEDRDLEELWGQLTPEDLRWLDALEPQQRPFAELAFCVHHGIRPVLERTGLSPASPPEHTHATGRGALAAGGSYYYADLVVEGLRLAGGDPYHCRRALDFGCSSGRTVRVLAAAYRDTEWHGCDPNEAAISWARDHLSGIAFEVSANDPPLSYPSEHFDLAFAISIWSHFSETAAAAWLAELGRVVRRGGQLLLTAQGYQSVAHFARSRSMSDEELARARTGMYQRGFWFAEDWFWQGGDYGVRSADWGMTFLTPEWILMQAPPAWALVGFQVGRAEGNQDLYVLQRR